MVEEDIMEVVRRHGRIQTAQYLTERLNTFVLGHPLTLDATPQILKNFLAELIAELPRWCEHGT